MGTDTGELVVRVRSPLGAGIAGVAVDVPRLGVMSTGTDGRANFGSVPANTYQIRAKKADHGPVPSGAGVFAIGEATASQTVVAGATSTVELQVTAVTSVKIQHTPVVAATPLRIYKMSATDVHVDHLLTCTALCPRVAGNGPGTQVPVRVEWTFTAEPGNAPKTKGGKDNTDVHFGAATGHAMSDAGTSAATTLTDDAGQTQILFRASVTSADRFTVQRKAQSWYDANETQLGDDLAALASSIGAPGYCMVGAAYYHPKMDDRPTTGHTSYYAGYPTVRLTYYGDVFHPDGKWNSVDGVNQDKMACLFLNVSGGSYASMVARHEIGHASDHVSNGPGDHCSQKSCLMYAFSTNNQFCAKPKEHSVRRTMGWLP